MTIVWPLMEEMSFISTPTAARWARQFLRRTMTEWKLIGAIEAAELVTSELTTNAIRATERETGPRQPPHRFFRRDVVTLALRCDHRRLLIEVGDSNPSPPVLLSPGLCEENGRGLYLVSAMCRNWGHYRFGEGKVVWAVLDLQSPGASCGGQRP